MATLIRISAFLAGISLAAAFGSGVAFADPINPYDAANGRAFCLMVAENPTPSGVFVAMQRIAYAVGEDAAVDGAQFGVTFICPEYSRVYLQAYSIYGY